MGKAVEIKSHERGLDDTTQWRIVQLLEAGVTYWVSVDLAKSGGDLHKMITAKEQGCPDGLLLRIYQ